VEEAPKDSKLEAAPKNSEKARQNVIAGWRHGLPFAVWIGVMFGARLLNLPFDPDPERAKHALGLFTYAHLYAAMTVLGAITLLICRPWRYYGPLRGKNILPAIGLGIAVIFLWVVFETDTMRQYLPWLAEFYERWMTMTPSVPFGEIAAEKAAVCWLPSAHEVVTTVNEAGEEVVEEVICMVKAHASPYSPAVAGWPLVMMRIFGSAFVIAIIEEFFWRGWLYRFFQHLDFLDVDLGKMHVWAYLGVAVLFGMEHREYVIGILTGLAWGYFVIRTRDLWAACISHITANLVLAIYVLTTGNYRFW